MFKAREGRRVDKKTKPRILSGVQPSGAVNVDKSQVGSVGSTNTHLGNYVGAFRQWVDMQRDFEALYMVVDLHAITLAYDHRVEGLEVMLHVHPLPEGAHVIAEVGVCRTYRSDLRLVNVDGAARLHA